MSNYVKKDNIPNPDKPGVYYDDTDERNGIGIGDAEKLSLGNWNSIVRNNRTILSALYRENIADSIVKDDDGNYLGRPIKLTIEPYEFPYYQKLPAPFQVIPNANEVFIWEIIEKPNITSPDSQALNDDPDVIQITQMPHPYFSYNIRYGIEGLMSNITSKLNTTFGPRIPLSFLNESYPELSLQRIQDQSSDPDGYNIYSAQINPSIRFESAFSSIEGVWVKSNENPNGEFFPPEYFEADNILHLTAASDQYSYGDGGVDGLNKSVRDFVQSRLKQKYNALRNLLNQPGVLAYIQENDLGNFTDRPSEGNERTWIEQQPNLRIKFKGEVQQQIDEILSYTIDVRYEPRIAIGQTFDGVLEYLSDDTPANIAFNGDGTSDNGNHFYSRFRLSFDWSDITSLGTQYPPLSDNQLFSEAYGVRTSNDEIELRDLVSLKPTISNIDINLEAAESFPIDLPSLDIIPTNLAMFREIELHKGDGEYELKIKSLPFLNSMSLPDEEIQQVPPTADLVNFLDKLGHPDYKFENRLVEIETEASVSDTPNFQVDCFVTTIDNDIDTISLSDIPNYDKLLYFNPNEERDLYDKSSYPVKVNLGISLFDVPGFTNGGVGASIAIDAFYEDWVAQSLVPTDVSSTNSIYYYKVVQWGDEDVILSDDDFLESEFFNVYEVDEYPEDNDFFLKIHRQNQLDSIPIISNGKLNLSSHVYDKPGIKPIKILVFRLTKDTFFILETTLVSKNILINDGSLLSQDFEIFGGSEYNYLPVRDNQIIIGGLDEDSKYIISSKKIKDNDSYGRDDILSKNSNIDFIKKYEDGVFGKSPDKVDLGNLRTFRGVKTLNQHIGDFHINSSSVDNSLISNIFIDKIDSELEGDTTLELNPQKRDFTSLQNTVGTEANAILIGDYELEKKNEDTPISKKGIMNKPQIENNKTKQAI